MDNYYRVNCQKHSGCVSASGKNAIYPTATGIRVWAHPVRLRQLHLHTISMIQLDYTIITFKVTKLTVRGITCSASTRHRKVMGSMLGLNA